MVKADFSHPPEFVKLLANDLRWGVIKALTSGDYQVNELVALLNQPMNVLSYHLKKMREDDLVMARRSDADGRDIYYSLNLLRLRDLFLDAGKALHPAITYAHEPTAFILAPQRILFVCTHNSARSQMAQGIVRHFSQGAIQAFSAGNQPTQVHPHAIASLRALGIDISQQQVHHLDDYAQASFDYIITVCDKAREVCPTFTGGGTHLHWGLPDPLQIEDERLRQEAFSQTAQALMTRIRHFLSLLSHTT